MLNPDSQIVWFSDLYECLFMADETPEGFCLTILFDDFPFDSPLDAQLFLTNSNLHGILKDGLFEFVLPVPEEDLVDVATRVAHRLVWRQ